MPSLRFDPEFWAVAGPIIAIRPPSAPKTALELRRNVNAGLGALHRGTLPEGIAETKHEMTSFDGEPVAIYQFAAIKDPPAAEAEAEAATNGGSGSGSGSGKQPAFVYVHGGGLVGGDIDPYTRQLAAHAALHTGVRMFAVEYRLAPEFPYPTPAEDCYAALKWLGENADGLGVDARRLGFYAVSAGGGLAAGAAMMARDRGLSPPPAKLMLMYPMLDDRTRVEAGDELSGFLTWTNRSNELGWNAYLGGGGGGDGKKGGGGGGGGGGGPDVADYAAPARATNLQGLPPTYLDVGGLDLFCAETVAFASRLAAADVQMELHVYPGLPHIFDLYAPKIESTRRAQDNRLRAAKSL